MTEENNGKKQRALVPVGVSSGGAMQPRSLPDMVPHRGDRGGTRMSVVITKLEIENFKRLHAVSVSPDGSTGHHRGRRRGSGGGGMKALTLHQPWAWAVAHAGKPVENRTWAPPARLFGQRIAIHAGKRYCPEAAAWMYEHGVDVRDPRRQSTGVVAVATVRGAIAVKGSSLQFNGTLDEHCVGEYADSFWFEGPVGWCLDRVIALPEPVPCRGAQGLWTLPEDAERSVRAQTAEVANG